MLHIKCFLYWLVLVDLAVDDIPAHSQSVLSLFWNVQHCACVPTEPLQQQQVPFLFPVTNTEGKALELHSTPSTSSEADPKDHKDRDREKDKDKEKEKDREKDIKKEVKKEKEESVSDDESQLSPAEQEQLRSLKEICRKVRLLPPTLPSICFYTFINAHQGWELD